jgi:DNA-binding NarL/FixJ family response regulator
MAEYVELKPKPTSYTKKRITELADAYSESRNVAVFNMARKQAYKDYRQFFNASFSSWHNHVIDLVEAIWVSISPNFSSKGCLYLASERKATAKSIAKYCQDHLSQEGWQTYVEMTHLPHTQAKRGKASGQARLALSADKREQAIELSKGGMKQIEIAKLLGVGQGTVSKWLAIDKND